jgi:hypothetical protein
VRLYREGAKCILPSCFVLVLVVRGREERIVPSYVCSYRLPYFGPSQRSSARWRGRMLAPSVATSPFVFAGIYSILKRNVTGIV